MIEYAIYIRPVDYVIIYGYLLCTIDMYNTYHYFRT